jgi:hypothetical protein
VTVRTVQCDHRDRAGEGSGEDGFLTLVVNGRRHLEPAGHRDSAIAMDHDCTLVVLLGSVDCGANVDQDRVVLGLAMPEYTLQRDQRIFDLPSLVELEILVF